MRFSLFLLFGKWSGNSFFTVWISGPQAACGKYLPVVDNTAMKINPQDCISGEQQNPNRWAIQVHLVANLRWFLCLLGKTSMSATYKPHLELSYRSWEYATNVINQQTGQIRVSKMQNYTIFHDHSGYNKRGLYKGEKWGSRDILFQAHQLSGLDLEVLLFNCPQKNRKYPEEEKTWGKSLGEGTYMFITA